MYMYYMGDWSLALHMYPELCCLDSGFHSNFLAVLVQSINFLLNVFLLSSKALLLVRLFAKSMSSNTAVKFHLFCHCDVLQFSSFPSPLLLRIGIWI